MQQNVVAVPPSMVTLPVGPASSTSQDPSEPLRDA
jgi:hypothetical protein